jgi:hypothetical protein
VTTIDGARIRIQPTENIPQRKIHRKTAEFWRTPLSVVTADAIRLKHRPSRRGCGQVNIVNRVQVVNNSNDEPYASPAYHPPRAARLLLGKVNARKARWRDHCSPRSGLAGNIRNRVDHSKAYDPKYAVTEAITLRLRRPATASDFWHDRKYWQNNFEPSFRQPID